MTSPSHTEIQETVHAKLHQQTDTDDMQAACHYKTKPTAINKQHNTTQHIHMNTEGNQTTLHT
jgi:hypothetical protein